MDETFNQELYITCKDTCKYLYNHVRSGNYGSIVVSEYNDDILDRLNVGLVFFFDTAEDIEYHEDSLAIEVRSFGEECLDYTRLYGKDIFDVDVVFEAASLLMETYISSAQNF